MRLIGVLALFGFLANVGCDIESDCSGTASADFTIGTDISTDFDVSNVALSAEVLTSSCTNLPAGTTTTEDIDTVARVTDTVTITENSEAVTFTVDGTTVQQFTRVQTVVGCEITLVLSGTMNATTNIIETTGAFAAKGVTCTAPF